MDTFGDMIDTVQSDLTIGDESVFLDLTAVKRAINRAKRKAEALFRWPGLEDAQKTSTRANQEHYDYPDKWRPDSIWDLWIDSNDNKFKDPLVFKDYLYEKRNDFPNGKKTIWANQGKKFFVLIDGVAPTADGNNNIEIQGFKTNTDDLVADDEETIFSYSIPICNEAIVMEAEAILKAKSDDTKTGQFFSAEALQSLTTEWGKIHQEQAKFAKTRPFFNVPDLFARGRTRPTKIGDFD